MKLPRWLPQGKLPVPSWGSVSVFCGLALLVQFYMAWRWGQSYEGPYPKEFQICGLTRDGLLGGRVWQIFSFGFFHGSWMHALGNLFLIYVMGERLKHIVGERAVSIALFGGLVAGGLLYVFFQPSDLFDTKLVTPMWPLVGASPAMFSLLLVMTGLSPDSKMWPIPVSGKNLGRGLLLSSLLLFLMTPGLRIPGFAVIGKWLCANGMAEIFQMGHVTHFGGALFGWFMARKLLGPKITLEHLQKQRQKREGG